MLSHKFLQKLSAKKIITTFKPLDFKNQFIDFAPHQEHLKVSVNDFFIHALQDKKIKLQLPFPPHRKTVNDFIFVTKGFATRQFGIVHHEIQANEFLSVPKLQISKTDFYSDDLQGFYCHFSDDFLQNNNHLDIQNTKVKLSEDVAARIHQLLEIIHRLFHQNWQLYKDLIAQYLKTVLIELSFQNNYTAPIGNRKKDLVTNFIELVTLHLNKRLSLSEYAHLLHITPNHLNKIVKHQLGKSAKEIHDEIILQEIKVLLFQTTKDIGEIAFELGFNDVSYFGKFFKRHTQQSPLEYRIMIEKHQ